MRPAEEGVGAGWAVSLELGVGLGGDEERVQLPVKLDELDQLARRGRVPDMHSPALREGVPGRRLFTAER